MGIFYSRRKRFWPLGLGLVAICVMSISRQTPLRQMNLRWSWEIIWKLKSQVSPFDPDFGNGNAFFPDVETTEDMFPAQGLVKS